MTLDCIKTVACVSLAGRGFGSQFTLNWKILDCSFYFCHLQILKGQHKMYWVGEDRFSV